MEAARMIFISGGVRSGKSSFAEATAEQLSMQYGGKLHYIACGMASDAEMRSRIIRHQTARNRSSSEWQTWECPYQLERIAANFTKQDTLVLDCVTTLLTNYLFVRNMKDKQAVIAQVLADINSLRNACGHLIVVSNEVFQDIPYQDTMTKAYQEMLGLVHQGIVHMSDQAYLIESGLLICKKGVIK